MAGILPILRLLKELRDPNVLLNVQRAVRSYKATPETTCPCCGFRGKFHSYGGQIRAAADCPACHSLERHRLVALALQRGFFSPAGKEVIHFAPEKIISRLVREASPKRYVTADLDPRNADVRLDLEALELENNSTDMVICSHVLEHVNDRKSLVELHRVLRLGGELIALVPLVEGWAATYEDPSVVTEEDRIKYFGKDDHVRYYGADFRERLQAAGFDVLEFGGGGRDSADFGLSRGEKVFRAVKRSGKSA